MATAILRPHDCLRPQPFYDPFSTSTPTPKPFPNRRRSRPVRSNQSTPSPPPKHGRPNPNPNPNNKSNRKCSSSSSPSTSPRSTSPSPSTSPPLQDGFRLLKRGESLPVPQPGSEKASPVRSKEQKHKQEVSPAKTLPFLRRSEPPPTTTTQVEKTPPPKKTQSDRAKTQLTTPPAKPIRVGSDTETIFAGPNFAVCAPEACCLPQPMYLLRSGSAGPASEDEASRTLRTLLKLQCL